MNHARTLRRAVGVAFVLLSVAATNAHAAVYDLKADWSDASNANGTWTYRMGATTLPSVPNWDKTGGADAAWAPSTNGGNFLPAWFRAVGSEFDFQTGDIVVHTTDPANGAPGGVENGPANVLWTSPSDGIATISGGLWDARQSSPARPQHWDLFVDGVLADSGTLPGTAGDGISRAAPDLFNLTNILLEAGDTIELRITRTDFFGDFVGVNLTIDLQAGSETAVLEPMSAIPLGVGLAGLAWARRRG